MGYLGDAMDQRQACHEPAAGEISLCTDQLCLSYGSKQALEGVSLEIKPRAVTAIIGPSGSGKSSFLCCLNRLTDLTAGSAVSGQVKVGSTEIYGTQRHDPVQLRRQVGMVFQRANPFPFSIWKNLALPLRHHGVRDKQQLRQRIESALQRVGLWDEVSDRLNTPAGALSGGQQQRLCIARALVLEPSILLMDEPCSALDPISTQRIERLILELKERYTIVIVTHDLAQARRIADHVALFWSFEGKGRLIEYGPAPQIFHHPTHELTGAYLAGHI